ncbi:hypothetical protein PMAYCL1PPCAC_13674 [Pristionchus mayeri]|uniref:Uncharacterized protein n=1 Tax=Pristionchus mayeri TaxID=1317129 RepID=A0AAN4ZP67_9BILA|nr:hypothetical protein PMAYCL1PPCAC_13674 [Pristionchus mayeri]
MVGAHFLIRANCLLSHLRILGKSNIQEKAQSMVHTHWNWHPGFRNVAAAMIAVSVVCWWCTKDLEDEPIDQNNRTVRLIDLCLP